jgi:hypothetical protein
VSLACESCRRRFCDALKEGPRGLCWSCYSHGGRGCDALPTVEYLDVSWHADALCAQVDTELWFPGKGGDVRPAKRVCAACPVRVECLDYALTTQQRFGIWGGVSERDRRKLSAQDDAEESAA